MPRGHIHNGGKSANVSAICPNCNTALPDSAAVHVTWGKNAAILVHYVCSKCKFYFTVKK